MAAATNDPSRHEAEASAPGNQIAMTLVYVGACGLLFAIGAMIGWGWRMALGVALGSAIAASNLWALHRIGAAFLTGKSRGLWALAGAGKFLVLAGLFAVVIKYRLVSPIAFVVGYGSLPVGITFGSLLGTRGSDSN